jgi:hypothetical protein
MRSFIIRSPEGERPLRRARHMWERNIRNDLNVSPWQISTGIYDQGWRQVAGCCEHGNGPSVKCGELRD